MTARPGTVPLLDTNQTNRTIPASGKVTDGYVLNDLLPASNANYLWGWAGDWLTWLDERSADGATPAFDLALQAVDAVGASGLAGGALSLDAGDGDGVGAGGALGITAGAGGTSGAGGALSLTSGAGGGAGAGGAFGITAGAGGTSGIGGAISLTSGAGGGIANGGAVGLTAGAGGATSGIGGAVSLNAGAGGGSGAGGALSFTAGNGGLSGAGGAVTIAAGNGGTLTAAGGALTISAGDSGGVGGGGGNLTISAGDDIGGAGAGGDIIIDTGNGVASKGDLDLKVGGVIEVEIRPAGVNINSGLVVGRTASSQPPTPDQIIIDYSQFRLLYTAPESILQFDSNDYFGYDITANKFRWLIGSTEELALDATNGLQVGDSNFAMRWDGTDGSIFFDSGDYIQYDRGNNRFNFIVASATEFYYSPVAGSGLNVDNPVRGTAAAGNAGLIGTSTGSESALFANSGGGTGHGAVIQADTTSPAKSALRLVPQNAAPNSSPQLGDMYVNTAGTLHFHDGSNWRTVQLV